MALSIRNIITDINTALESYLKSAVYYGVAQPMEREGLSSPVVNERPVSFDDSYGIIIYHKLGEIVITRKPGYGANETTTNTFAVSAIVFNNERRTGLQADEIAMIIQSVLTQQNITSVKISPTRVILNSQAIWQTEYRGHAYGLPEYASLMQLNYTVEITFKSGCFDLCPEDFSQCKIN